MAAPIAPASKQRRIITFRPGIQTLPGNGIQPEMAHFFPKKSVPNLERRSIGFAVRAMNGSRR